MLVVQDNHLDINSLGIQCAELLNVHLERTVTVNVDDGFLRARDLGSHCGGEPEAHGAEPPRCQELARIFVFVKLCRPHLMLSHAGNDDCIAMRQFIELLNDELRLRRSVWL